MRGLLSIIFICLFSQIAFAQSLNEQWNSLLEEAETYQSYKVIQRNRLSSFWSVVQDSVRDIKSEVLRQRQVITQQESEIANLQDQIDELQQNLEAVSEERDNMMFLGMPVDKNVYATTLWIIILLLLIGAAILFLMFKNSNKVTQQKKTDYDHLFNRFEEYKKNKIEKERLLKRELQTYMNTIEDLKKKGRG